MMLAISEIKREIATLFWQGWSENGKVAAASSCEGSRFPDLEGASTLLAL
jgi:hypothetical protein